MHYHIITRMESIGGEITHTPIGHVTDHHEAEEIIKKHLTPLTDWIEENREALEAGELDQNIYFDTNPPVYQVGWETEAFSVDTPPLIEDIENLDNY